MNNERRRVYVLNRHVRKVPKDWEHPIDDDGEYIPLFDGNRYESDLLDWEYEINGWDVEKKQWDAGFIKMDVLKEQVGRKFIYKKVWCPKSKIGIKDRFGHEWTWDRWKGDKPPKINQENYTPNFPIEERTHWVLYEDVSVGTPISPKFETPELLADWLAKNLFEPGFLELDYEDWLIFITQEKVVIEYDYSNQSK